MIKKKLKQGLILTGILLYSSILACGYTIVLKETTGNDIVIHTFQIEPSGSNYLVKLTKKSEKQEIHVELELDSSFSTLKWKYNNPNKGIDISAFREDTKIFLSGTNKSKTINKKFDVGSLPWKQIFSFDLEGFIASGKNKMEFCALGAEGPGAMASAKFSATVQGNDRIVYQGEEVETTHLKISLTGIKSAFWKGDYWYRKSDNKFLRYQSGGGANSPSTITELISEER